MIVMVFDHFMLVSFDTTSLKACFRPSGYRQRFATTMLEPNTA
jgi:hypothetical protein